MKRSCFFAELKKDFYAQAKQTGLYAEYLKTYDVDSLEAFILEFAERKAYLAESYEYYLMVSDKAKEIKFREEAMEVFEIIQQKKLFNLQLQWRAEKITLKGITLCCDFDFWSYHIQSCPIVPLVTRFYVDIAIKYLLDRGYSEFIQCDSNWQDYNSLMGKMMMMMTIMRCPTGMIITIKWPGQAVCFFYPIYAVIKKNITLIWEGPTFTGKLPKKQRRIRHHL